MAKAAGLGLRVSKPYGDSASYDVGVESAGRILRVQVKSTLYRRRGIESYSLNVHGPRRQLYKDGSVDFFAVYLIPRDTWYILPFEEMGGNFSLHFTPGGRAGEVGAVSRGVGAVEASKPPPLAQRAR